MLVKTAILVVERATPLFRTQRSKVWRKHTFLDQRLDRAPSFKRRRSLQNRPFDELVWDSEGLVELPLEFYILEAERSREVIEIVLCNSLSRLYRV